MTDEELKDLMMTCEHGSLQRKCLICELTEELIALRAENARLLNEGTEVVHDLRAKLDVAEADNARLREAVEWAMSPEGKRFALQLNWAEFTTELRRRAKEG